MDIKNELRKLWDGTIPYHKLSKLTFNEVGMRGVKGVTLKFKHPVTAIAGANGVGKTTILQTIACLFHNADCAHHPYRFTNAKNQSSYYRFTDFFITSRGEPKSEGIKITYKYHEPNVNKTKFSVSKGGRWSNYDRRPKRCVDFLGISRVLPAHESAIFIKSFSGRFKASVSSPLDSGSQIHVSSITGKNLEKVTEEISPSVQNFKLGKIKDNNGLEYSSFNMGAGEEVAITLISRISSLPTGSIVLIEEIELGLHPRAQKELINALLQIVYKKKIQLIFTTHSPYIFDSLPSESKILLRKTNGILDVISSPSNSLAFIELTGSCLKELTIYVEDLVAKQLVENLFNASISKRIEIIDVGSKENVVRMTSGHYINSSLGLAMGVGDGDLTDKEIKNWCKKYMNKDGKTLDRGALEEIKEVFFRKLPSDKAPEKYIFEKLKEDKLFREDIDDSEEFAEFVENKLGIAGDHHALFYKIAQELSKDINGIRASALKFVAKNYEEDFISIKQLVQNKLQENGSK